MKGVKKLRLLCVIPDIPETHFNIKQIMELLKLDQLKCVYSMDHKMNNILLGLSVRIEKTRIA